MTGLRTRSSRPAARRRTAASVATIAAPLCEKDFLRQITDLCAVLGWEWAHFRPAVTTRGWRTPVSGTIGEGFVDLVLVRVRDRRLVFAELKAERGRLTERQEEVLAILRGLATDPAWSLLLPHALAIGRITRIEVYLWRPSDWDAIVEVLR